MKNLSNIKLSDFRKVLAEFGAYPLRVAGGHEIWAKQGITRTIVFQTHVEPVPEFVVKNAIRDLGISRQEFVEMLESL